LPWQSHGTYEIPIVPITMHITCSFINIILHLCILELFRHTVYTNEDVDVCIGYNHNISLNTFAPNIVSVAYVSISEVGP